LVKRRLVIVGPQTATEIPPVRLVTPRYAVQWHRMVALVGPPEATVIGHDHEPVGFLIFDDQHQVLSVSVKPGYRRLGIATDLWKTTRKACPDLRHSDEMTAAGKAWVTSLGDWMHARAAVLIEDMSDAGWGVISPQNTRRVA
jgi:hypothetical protein